MAYPTAARRAVVSAVLDDGLTATEAAELLAEGSLPGYQGRVRMTTSGAAKWVREERRRRLVEGSPHEREVARIRATVERDAVLREAQALETETRRLAEIQQQ